ncbi:MAG TPA: diguanylate cyclase, partial [Micromonosporaceae bacterium]
VAWMLLYAALTAASQHSESLARFVANVVYLFPIMVATGLSVVAAIRTRRRVQVAWARRVVSNLLGLAGEAIWTGYAYATPGGAPIPSAADIGYLLSYVVALPAVLIGLGMHGLLGGVRGLLDTALVAIGVAAIGWQLTISPLLAGPWNPAAVVTFTYPVLSVSIASILIAVWISGRRAVPWSMLLATAAFAVASIADAGYTYLVVVESYSDSSWMNLGWQGEAVLLGIAALVAIRLREDDLPRTRIERDVAVLPAVVAVLAVAALATADRLEDGQLSNITLGVALVLFLGLLLRQFLAIRDRTQLAERLRAAAITDPLTGLYNRRFFDEVLRVEAVRAERLGSPLSLIMVDLDDFKNVNDSYGHAAGDQVLAEAAERLRSSLRATDVVARYGGEEFVCLLPGTREESAVALAEHVRSVLSRTPVPVPDRQEQVRLTASLGVASARPRPRRSRIDTDDLLYSADEAVYQAKAQGRNRVMGGQRAADLQMDTEHLLAPELTWLADQIDAMVGDREHAAAVSRWSQRTAARLGLDLATQRRAAAAGRLHDIGKVTIGRDVLSKPGPLNEWEWEQLRRHPDESARLVVELGDRPDLADLVAAHHERYDGGGYPRGLVGEEIPLPARIITVCDAWAAMRTGRAYAPAVSAAEARARMLAGCGTQFDPVVVEAFLDLLDRGFIDNLAPLPGPGRRTGDERQSRRAAPATSRS